MINWIVRYAQILARFPELSDPHRSVLEVGCGTQGLARYLERPIVGLDFRFSGPLNPNLRAVSGTVLCLPFADDAFDDVVCVDTLEHLAMEDRLAAVWELERVARKRIIISGPTGVFATFGDRSYAQFLQQAGVPIPDWLEEHLRFGIPAIGELLELLLQIGHPFEFRINEALLQHYGGLLADGVPFLAHFGDVHAKKNSRITPLAGAEGDVPYSLLASIDVSSPRHSGLEESERAPLDIVRTAKASRDRSRSSIFAVGHRVDRMPAIPGIQRLLAGAAALGDGVDPEILRETTGVSIFERNPGFSEMSAIYWIWKNVRNVDGVGVCHYRRYFDFRSTQNPSTERQTTLRDPHEVASLQHHFADPIVVERHVSAGDIVVAQPYDVGIPVPDQYMLNHVGAHYLEMLNYLLHKHAHLDRQVLSQAHDHRMTVNNMLLMRWSDFDELCGFWFDCLFALEGLLATGSPLGYQGRVIAFLSERVLDIHIRRLRDRGRNIVEYPIFYLEEPAFSP